jgi:serine/threonine protein kinase/Flp pilus assembly protein TadD
MTSEHNDSCEQEEGLSAALVACLEAIDSGPPDRQELLARYPQFATELARFLDDQEQVDRYAAPLRCVAGRPTPPQMGDDGLQQHIPTAMTLGDFRIIREAGRGGMGVVYEAEQLSLRRRVALKVLPFAAIMDPRHLQRFHNEAQAAARLHHTNIVPVFAVGSERGVHYYAMQFIDGQTLAAVIEQLRQASKQPEKSVEGPSYVPTPQQPAPAEDQRTTAYVARPAAPVDAPSTEQAALLTEGPVRGQEFFRAAARVGVQVAEALDYAHQCGVVHRDVKPANLLVDAAGVLWVTDFGLAQLQQNEASLTMTGDLVGTLRYMSPEQALAKRVVVDHRTDIYSLGVTLYELLTLKPAFGGLDRHELLRQVAFEEPRRPRQINRAIPGELETIVLKAMEKNAADRYATAQELADDLRRWLEDRPIQARRPSWRQVARKWARRHRAPVRAAAVVLLLAVTMLAGTLGWGASDRAARRWATEQVVVQALDEAASWQQKGRLPEALSAARRAAGLVAGGEADEALRSRVQARVDDLELVAELEEVRLQMTAVKVRGFDFDYELADRLFAEAFQRAGLDIEALPAAEAGGRIRACSVAAELAAALDHWALTRQEILGRSAPSWKHLLRVARAADPDSWRDRVRDALERGNQQALEKLAGSEAVLRQRPSTLTMLGTALQRRGAVEPVEALLRQAWQRHPEDFWVNLDLGVALGKARPAHWDEAIRFYTVAVALRPQSPGARMNLGVALKKKGRLDEAIAEYQEAIRLKKDFPPAHNNLGVALAEKGRLVEAIAEYREAIRLNKDYPGAHSNLGNALREKGRVDEAIAEHRVAIRLKEDFAGAHCNLGIALVQKGQLDEAIAEYREAIRLDKDDALAHNNLGNALKERGGLLPAARPMNPFWCRAL